eukprot:9237232-Pyramimonas_sp.AAC.1
MVPLACASATLARTHLTYFEVPQGSAKDGSRYTARMRPDHQCRHTSYTFHAPIGSLTQCRSRA